MLWALVGFCGVHCAATVQTDTLHVWVHAACLQSSRAGDGGWPVLDVSITCSRECVAGA